MKPVSQIKLDEYLPLRGRWLGYLIEGAIFLPVLGCAVYAARPRYTGCQRDGRYGAAKTRLGQFATALELYRRDHGGRYPITAAGLQRLISEPSSGTDHGWRGPYLNDVTVVFRDPWDHRYQYQSPGPAGEAYVLTCYGSDGRPGGPWNAEDIVKNGTWKVVR